MPAERAERIRRWHEAAYAGARADGEAGPRTVDYLGLTLVIPPRVQPIVPVSHLLGEAVMAEVRADDRVLDMGTGSGVNAILAARTAREVVAVDINPYAVEAAAANAERNGVADRIRVTHGDVYDDVDGAFDLIIFDPPFRWFAPRDELEAATTDENYRAMTAFFRGARARLTERGRMLIFFGTTGDVVYLEELADGAGFDRAVVARLAGGTDDWPVEYRTYRMWPASPSSASPSQGRG
jgi:release factor glutamine methyltransferase